MSASGLSKAVLSSPGQSESNSSDHKSCPTSSLDVFTRLRVDYSVGQVVTQLQRESHNRRMKFLRKELSNLQSTAWKYQPIDKYIGQ